jgi:hypothetical protein
LRYIGGQGRAAPDFLFFIRRATVPQKAISPNTTAKGKTPLQHLFAGAGDWRGSSTVKTAPSPGRLYTPSPMDLHNLLCDRQAESAAAGGAMTGFVRFIKPL